MSARFGYLRHASLTDVGRKRDHNEDAHGVFAGQGAFVVADGMGGGEAGEVASHLAVDSAKDALAGAEDLPGVDNLVVKERLLRRAANQACRSIRAYVAQRGYQRSGSTLAALVFDANQPRKALALHAGDSRVYRVRKGKIEQLTKDHSVAAAAGIKHEAEIPDFIKGVITRAVGIMDSVELEATPVEAKAGDVFLICSDGLSNMVPDAQMARMVKARGEGSLDDLAAKLVEEANAAGGKDNITVILVEVAEDPVFDQPEVALTIPEAPASAADDEDTSPTGGTSASRTAGPLTPSDLGGPSAAADPPTTPTANASPDARPATPPGPAPSGAKMTFDGLARMAGPEVARAPGRGLPMKVWIALALALLAILIVVVALPGRKGAPPETPSSPPPKPGDATPSVPPKAVDPIPLPPPTPVPEPAPAEPLTPPPPVPPAPTPPTPAPEPSPPPSKPPEPDDASGLAAALATMKDLRAGQTAPAPTNTVTPTATEAVMPKTPPVEPPPPPEPPPPAKPALADLQAALRAAETNGSWGAVIELLAAADPALRDGLPPGQGEAMDAWNALWTDARQQGDLTAWFDEVINLEDEWREFLPALSGDPLPAPAALTPDAYVRLFREFSRRLPERAREARPVWDSIVRAFGHGGAQSLANYRTFYGRAFQGEALSELEGQWASYATGSELLRRLSEHDPSLPVARETVKALTGLRLRQRTLLAVNTAAAVVRCSTTKGGAILQQTRNVLIGHRLDQTPGMGLLDEVGERTTSLRAAGDKVDLKWLGDHADKLSRLLESIDRFVKWQSEQPNLKAP